jgi:hypothetical protein
MDKVGEAGLAVSSVNFQFAAKILLCEEKFLFLQSKI